MAEQKGRIVNYLLFMLNVFSAAMLTGSTGFVAYHFKFYPLWIIVVLLGTLTSLGIVQLSRYTGNTIASAKDPSR